MSTELITDRYATEIAGVLKCYVKEFAKNSVFRPSHLGMVLRSFCLRFGYSITAAPSCIEDAIRSVAISL